MKTQYALWIVASVAAISLFACTQKKVEETTTTTTTTTTAPTTTTTAPVSADSVTELKIEDVKVGTGAVASAGKKITVHYTGTLLNGTKFDSSVDRGQPFSFTLGQGQVIEGWDKGFDGMKVGGKRKLTIPAKMAYGDRAMGDKIPANSPLVFDVELLGVE